MGCRSALWMLLGGEGRECLCLVWELEGWKQEGWRGRKALYTNWRRIRHQPAKHRASTTHISVGFGFWQLPGTAKARKEGMLGLSMQSCRGRAIRTIRRVSTGRAWTDGDRAAERETRNGRSAAAQTRGMETRGDAQPERRRGRLRRRRKKAASRAAPLGDMSLLRALSLCSFRFLSLSAIVLCARPPPIAAVAVALRPTTSLRHANNRKRQRKCLPPQLPQTASPFQTFFRVLSSLARSDFPSCSPNN